MFKINMPTSKFLANLDIQVYELNQDSLKNLTETYQSAYENNVFKADNTV